MKYDKEHFKYALKAFRMTLITMVILAIIVPSIRIDSEYELEISSGKCFFKFTKKESHRLPPLTLNKLV